MKQCYAWHVLASNPHAIYIHETSIPSPFIDTMGNCIILPCVHSPSKNLSPELATVVDSATEQGNDPLLDVVPCLKELENLLVYLKTAYSSGGGAREVKIVVTREQFKLLLANAKKMQSAYRLLSYRGPGRGRRKWRPMLSVISEEEE